MLRGMNYGYADQAVVAWSESQKRFQLHIYEGGQILYTWVLANGFDAPELEIMPGWLGIEDINARLASVSIYPSGANDWDRRPDGHWVRTISPNRARGENDH